jgi:hypothetical protein
MGRREETARGDRDAMRVGGIYERRRRRRRSDE